MDCEWEEPRDPHLLHNKEPVDGVGWGPMDPKFLSPQRWEPLLREESGRGQYTRFIAQMLNRIRFEESNLDEIRLFVDLIGNKNNADFLRVAMPWIPELKEPMVRQERNFQISLLIHELKKVLVSRKELEASYSEVDRNPHTYEKGLSDVEKNTLHYMMFGPAGGGQPTERMKSLFESTVSLAFPQAALDHVSDRAKRRGRDIERDHQGLPTNLCLPAAEMRPPNSAGPSSAPCQAPSVKKVNQMLDLKLPPQGLMTLTPLDNIKPLKSREYDDGVSTSQQSVTDQQLTSHNRPGEPKRSMLSEMVSSGNPNLQFIAPQIVENEQTVLHPHDDVAALRIDTLDAEAFTKHRERFPDLPQVPQDENTVFEVPPWELAALDMKKERVDQIPAKPVNLTLPAGPITKDLHDKIKASNGRRAQQSARTPPGLTRKVWNINGPLESP